MALAPIKEKYTQLKEFFQWWIPAYLPGKGLYLKGQSAPRPPNPYIAFSPLDDVEMVGLDERRFDSQGNEILRGQRIITCSLEGYSDSGTRFDGGDNAWEMLQELRFSLCYPEVYDRLTSINCRVIDPGTVDDSSETLNTTNEPRASLTCTLSTVIVQSRDNGAIEIVNAEGDLEASNGTKQADVSVTKP